MLEDVPIFLPWLIKIEVQAIFFYSAHSALGTLGWQAAKPVTATERKGE